MSSDIPAIAQHILHTLLDRFEQPLRRTVVRVRLDQSDHSAYFSQTDAAPRLQANQTLEQLERDGALMLHWVKWERGNWLQAVDLVPEHANLLYKHLQRLPRGEQADSLGTMLAFETGHAPWHAAFLGWAQGQLALHKSVAPLKLDEPRWNRDLLRALASIAQLTEPVLERALSVRLFNDSKRLELLRSAIVSVLRRHDPGAAEYGDDQSALLRAHHLDRVPEYVPLAGSLVLVVAQGTSPSAVVDLEPLAPSIALPATLLRTVTVAECRARSIVTVENATSFSELTAIRPRDILVVYTAGFASPTLITLLRRVRVASPSIPLFHWGDLDAGGLRILAHLRSHLGAVTPLAMDPKTLDDYQAHAQPLTSGDASALAHLRAVPALADCVPLIDALVREGQKLEQEAVRAESVVSQLQRMQ